MLAPLAQSSRSERAGPDSTSVAPSCHTSPVGILVVEDDDLVGETIRIELQKGAYQVYRATTGMTALELARTHAAQIKIVILDYLLPDMRAEDLIFEFTKILNGPKIIGMSGYAYAIEPKRRFAQLVESVIQKPVPLKELHAAVDQLLE